MDLSNFCCEKCPLKFDKKIILDTHLHVVHQEKIEIKEESITVTNKSNIGEEGSCHVESVLMYYVKGHFFSDRSALTNRPDAITQLIFLRIFSSFFGFFA